MKTQKFISTLIIISALLSTLWGCNNNPGWDHTKPSGKAGELAEKSCACVYETMSEMKEFDTGRILEQIKDFPKNSDLDDDEIKKKWPDIYMALSLEAVISEKVDASECFKQIDDDLFEKGIDFEDMMDILDGHCSLGIFYN